MGKMSENLFLKSEYNLRAFKVLCEKGVEKEEER
jgi:hypothetical protein